MFKLQKDDKDSHKKYIEIIKSLLVKYNKDWSQLKCYMVNEDEILKIGDSIYFLSESQIKRGEIITIYSTTNSVGTTYEYEVLYPTYSVPSRISSKIDDYHKVWGKTIDELLEKVKNNFKNK